MIEKYERPNVDPDRLFYHGTDAYFEKFEDSFRGSNTEWRNTLHGFFFAETRENAMLFGNTVITAHIDIKNPIDLRLRSIFNDESQASIIWEILSGDKLDNKAALATINDEIGLGEIGDLYDILDSDDGHAMMVAAGYDGVVSSLGNEQNEYVVFGASQIMVLSIERGLFRGYKR